MKAFLKSFLSFTKTERRGIVFLCLVLFLVLCIPGIYKAFFLKADQSDFSKLNKAIAEMEQAKTIDANVLTINETAANIAAAVLFPFDPNTATETELLKLGFSGKLAHTMLNYRSKGGKFKSANDLKKIYGMSANLFQQLLPYVHIESELQGSFKKPDYIETSKSTKYKTSPVVELNTVDSVVLLEVKGIGPAYASRILKYRKLLGGYVQIQQLREVYGMDSMRYAAIAPQLRINAALAKKININTATAEELRRHPYIRNYTTANVVINFRKQHGDFQQPEDLRKCLMGNAELYKKFAPYIILH